MTSVPIAQTLEMSEKFAPSALGVEETNKVVLDDGEAAGFDPGATKRLVRKIDFVIIPFVALLYAVHFSLLLCIRS